jgi:subtilisin family serine protease
MYYSFYPSEGYDGNGHGTHVAGTIGSTTYGVAKEVNLYAIKVLDDTGNGRNSDVIAGIDMVIRAAKPGQTVINMSLGGGQSVALNSAVNAAYSAGVVVVVAAGNNGADACMFSPAGAADAFSVGATDASDTVATYSNQGRCVSLFAPGTAITSLWIGSNGAINTISGTSMASPHVAGIAALFMAQKQYTSAGAVYADLKSAATTGVLKHVRSGTANRLAYNGGG